MCERAPLGRVDMQRHAAKLLVEGTCEFSSGRGRTAVRGRKQHAARLLERVTSALFNGFESLAARGTRNNVAGLLAKGI